MLHKEITTMINEIERQSSDHHRTNRIRQLYLPLQMPARRLKEKEAQRTLKGVLKMNGMNWTFCETDQLMESYHRICDKLTHRHQGESLRTPAEYKMKMLIRHYTRLQTETSLWIGNVNVDLFIPAVKIGNTLGLAIELDGRVHYRELKGRKDTFKQGYLKSLGICVFVIENHDLTHPCVLSFLEKLKTMKRGCSKKRQLLWRRIYLETILHHGTTEELRFLFGYSFD